MGSLREELEAAMESGDVAPVEAPAAAPMEAAPLEAAPVEPVADAPAEGKARAPDGKFAKAEAKPAVAPPVPGVEGVPEVKPEAKAVTPALKAPQSWKPDIREKWAGLPAEVQQEVARRERETAQALQGASEAKKMAQEFERTVSPFMAMIQAEGATPMAAVGNLLQTAAALRTAPPQHKAALVANMMKTFGISEESLVEALSGQPQAGAAQQYAQPMTDPRVDALMAKLQAAEQRQQATLQQQAMGDLQAFTSSGDAEFFEDVRETMADLLEVAARRGVALSVKDAYNQALRIDPRVSGVVSQREAAKAAATAQATTQRAKMAASSVKSTPAGESSKPQGESVRAAIEAAFSAASGR